MGSASKAAGTVAGGAVLGAPGAVAGFASEKAGGAFSSIVDPLDITGERRSKQRKEFEKRQKEGEKLRRKEVDELFKEFSPGDIERTKGLRSRAISGQLSPGLSRAEGDVGFLRGFARAEGPSSQAQGLLQAQRLEEQTGLEGLSEQAALQQAGQLSSLAQQGGAGAGARERLAAQSQSGQLRESQRQRRSGQLSRAGILSEDEARKLSVAGKLPGQEVGIGAERRAGLSFDETQRLGAAQATQQSRLRENLANLQTQQQGFQARAGILGGQQLSRAQRQSAGQQEKTGPLGQSGGFLGLPSLGSIFG